VSAVMSPIGLMVDAEERVSVAFELAAREGAHYLAVMAGSQGCVGLVGIDELRVWAEAPAAGTRPPIGALVDRPDVRIRPAAPLVEAARLMATYQTDAVLVADGARLVGLLTWRDVVRWVAGLTDPRAERRSSRPALFVVPSAFERLAGAQ
ncbi:MAG TPA: CBS domain-containing protein, partial [Mycobacteriales bacterium]|nr:CBS domain-containing protein [Mycobacteriales bacterium]